MSEYNKDPRRVLNGRGIKGSAAALIYRRDGNTCQYCGETLGRMALDHVIPHKQGGPTAEFNLVVACWACNSAKSNNVWLPRNIDVLAAVNPAHAERIRGTATHYNALSPIPPAPAPAMRLVTAWEAWVYLRERGLQIPPPDDYSFLR